MRSVYASKLFLASNRQEKIRAAIENPVNAELVAQISEYLDDEYKSTAVRKKEDKTEDKADKDTKSSHASKGSRGSTRAHESSGSNFPLPPSDAFEGDDLEFDDLDDLVDDPADGSDELDEVENATKVNKQAVEAASSLNISNAVSEIKGMLNLNADTAGVIRVASKDNELWIYYNDSTNLNNVMANVIDLVSASGYSYLEFNRLARSDNSIVFQINELDSNLDEVDDGNK